MAKAGGGAVYGRGGTLTMNACEARGGYEKQGVRGGGGGVLSVLGPIRKVGRGGRAACRTMIYILVCKHVRGEWSGGEEGGISYEWGGGGEGGSRPPPPPPPPPKPMLDPGLVSVYRSDLPWHIHIRKYLRGALI